MKLYEPGVMDIINRNRSGKESYSEIAAEALANLNVYLTNPVAFSQ